MLVVVVVGQLCQRRVEESTEALSANDAVAVPQSCTVALSMVRTAPQMQLREARLHRCLPFSGEPAATAAYRFHALGSNKVEHAGGRC